MEIYTEYFCNYTLTLNVKFNFFVSLQDYVKFLIKLMQNYKKYVALQQNINFIYFLM